MLFQSDNEESDIRVCYSLIVTRKPALRNALPPTPMELPPIALARPKLRGTLPLETCLQSRRSARTFAAAGISMSDFSQVLWAAQGITGLGGLRTAPSAGGLFPIRTYAVISRIAGLPAGIYKYNPDEHYIRFLVEGAPLPELIGAGLDGCSAGAPVLIVLAADYRSPIREFGDKAQRLVQIEAGHIGQNICLEATALGLGVIGLGSFDPVAVRSILQLKEQEQPLYMLAVGKKPGVEAVV